MGVTASVRATTRTRHIVSEVPIKSETLCLVGIGYQVGKSRVPISDEQPDTQHLASRACHRHLLLLLLFPRIHFEPQLRPLPPCLAHLFYISLCRKVAWRVAGARALWTWSDLGRNLRNTPGWLHASMARWRTVATYVALAGAASRVLVRRFLV